MMKVHFGICGTQDMVKKIVCGPLLTWHTQVSKIYLVLEGGRKSTKNGLATGVAIGGDAAKIGKDTHLLVIIRMR